ncbi:MAG: hypothetical protein FWH14_03845, partial [Oscillospiraceae bacterium]|nr:hypothetical protein [Oscillospiraceae bacterium]
GGVVCRDDRPRSSVVIAAAGWSVGAAGCRPWLLRIVGCFFLPLPLGEVSCVSMTERAPK